MSEDLTDARSHPKWATEFFSGETDDQGDGTWRMTAPRMSGRVLLRIDVDVSHAVIDMYMAPEGAPFGPPLPVRVVPNRDGADVLFTLARFPGQSDEDWSDGLESMNRELLNLKARHEK